MVEGKGTRMLKGTFLIIGILLIILYLLSAFNLIEGFGFKQISGLTFLILIIVLIFVIVWLVKKSAGGDAFDLNTVVLILAGAGIIYLFIKFPALVPSDYLGAVQGIKSVANQIPIVNSIINFP